MRKKFMVFIFLIFVLGLSMHSSGQFTPEEIAEREGWEEFLKTAKVIDQSQPWGKGEAVTDPWELTLDKNGIIKKALWKNQFVKTHLFPST